MAKVGVLLAGCGVYDGTEIHEAVLTMLALDRSGHEIMCLAPDIPQTDVMNHFTGEHEDGERRVINEAARIARGKIRDLAEVHESDIDGLVLPGGFGAAKNLSTFAMKAANCTVNEDVRRIILEMHAAQKPICAICIAPTIVAKVLGEKGVSCVVTIGDDPGTAEAIRHCGAMHKNCPVDQCVVDVQNRVITTPAYMLATRISEVATGIRAAIEVLDSLMGRNKQP